MKLYRLIEILIYLLNHKQVTAKFLAEKFEVSKRTIQRDMDALLIAGIPIESISGMNGGYYLDSTYKLENHFVSKDDFSFIIKALKSYSTYQDDKQLDIILQKYISLYPKQCNELTYLDYGISKENADVQAANILIEQAIHANVQITFDYYTVHNFKSHKKVQPLVLRFQWYNWYLFAYDVNKADYRTYKIARIKNIRQTTTSFEPYDAEIIQSILKQHDATYLNTCEEVCIWCHKDSIQIAKENFPVDKIETLQSGDFQVYFSVPKHEQLWQANLLHMGKSVRVISPITYRENLVQRAKDFLLNNDI